MCHRRDAYAATAIALDELPPTLSRRLPRYSAIPAALVGRLAVDSGFQGRRIGALLLADAAIRASASPVIAYALVVEAASDGASDFYRHLGFAALSSSSRTLFLPLETTRALSLPR
jgi:GNAT superfamily N-acetyltransferase